MFKIKICCLKECNDLGEVTDILWHPNGKFFFTAGNDKKIKMFEMLNENCSKKFNLSSLLISTIWGFRYTFTGATQTVNRIDIDTERKHILGAGNDHTVHIWSIEDQRHRVTP